MRCFLYDIGRVVCRGACNMGKTIKPGDLADPKLRIRIFKNKMGFTHVGEGNPDAIKGQQSKLASCARSAKGLKGAEFKAAVKKCAKK